MGSVSFSVTWEVLLQSFSIGRKELVQAPKAFALLQLPGMTSFFASRDGWSTILSVASDSESPSSVGVMPPVFGSYAGLKCRATVRSQMISDSKLPAVFAFSPVLCKVNSTLTIMQASNPFMSVEVTVQLSAMHAFTVETSGPSQLTYTMFVHAAFVPTSGDYFVGSASRHLSRVRTAVLIYFGGVIFLPVVCCALFVFWRYLRHRPV